MGMVEIGGQTMTQEQFDAARYPLLHDSPFQQGDEVEVVFRGKVICTGARPGEVTLMPNDAVWPIGVPISWCQIVESNLLSALPDRAGTYGD